LKMFRQYAMWHFDSDFDSLFGGPH